MPELFEPYHTTVHVYDELTTFKKDHKKMPHGRVRLYRTAISRSMIINQKSGIPT